MDDLQRRLVEDAAPACVPGAPARGLGPGRLPDGTVRDFILGGVRQIRSGPPTALTLAGGATGRNQFCAFLKPWATDPGVDLPAVIDVVLERARAHGLAVDEVALLPGALLAQEQVMARHYWRMTDAARRGAAAFSPGAWARVGEIFSERTHASVVLGGYEFLTRYPDISSLALEVLWENARQHRLAPSVSCAGLAIEGNFTVIVNGFVPRLLEAYERPQTVLVVFSLSGDLSWADARRRFVGHTDPARAAAGSLRSEFLHRRDALALRDLRLGANGVHLSAGPLEALVELDRLFSLAAPMSRGPEHYSFGRGLARELKAPALRVAFANPEVVLGGARRRLFDFTEEMDADEALGVVEAVRPQLEALAFGASVAPDEERSR